MVLDSRSARVPICPLVGILAKVFDKALEIDEGDAPAPSDTNRWQLAPPDLLVDESAADGEPTGRLFHGNQERFHVRRLL